MEMQTNILIVDDESRIIRTLGRLMRPHYQTFLANSGEEALDILRNNRIHVIISDQRMPEMTGVELLSKVKQLSPNTTRVLLTGYSDLSAVVNSVNEGEIFRYITKPWNNDELFKTVKQAADISLKLFDVKVVPENKSETSNDNEISTILTLDSSASLKPTLEGVIGRKAQIVSVISPIDAMDYLATHNVNIVITNSSDNLKEDLAFVKVTKANYPQILSVVITEEADSHRVIGLINEGQIYRYLIKPVNLGLLKIYLLSALRYQKKLLLQPELAIRHQVAEIQDEEGRKLGASLFQRLRSFFGGHASPMV
ncbi:MAG: response regulator [Gammaproteobacteria bacterium]|nr:response regulator [Gammaproteobacteria bacterium]MCF6260762.1 response regulator [Gammaproteobacteria bacterium]